MRIGSSLSNCSSGFLYKVVSTSKSAVVFIDNNGQEATARKNSNKWDFNPSCNVNESNVGSKLPQTNSDLNYQSSSNKPSHRNSAVNKNSNCDSDFTTGLIVGSLFL